MYLEDFADKVGKSYQTVYQWYRKGKIPGAYQLVKRGKIIVPDDAYSKMLENHGARSTLSKDETVNLFVDDLESSYFNRFGVPLPEDSVRSILDLLGILP